MYTKLLVVNLMSGDHLGDEMQMAEQYLKPIRQIGCSGVKLTEMVQDRTQWTFTTMVIYFQVQHEAGNVSKAGLRYVRIYKHNKSIKSCRKRISRRPNINK
jgi:hypothetical protein